MAGKNGALRGSPRCYAGQFSAQGRIKECQLKEYPEKSGFEKRFAKGKRAKDGLVIL
jgi:hypothetical protein